DVALLARSAEELAATARLIEEMGRKVLTLPTDVTHETAVEEAAEAVLESFGKVDILVNNAGIATVAPLLELTLSQLKSVLEVNVVGAFLCARAFGAHMVAQRKGTVINVASIAGLGGEPDVTAYSASKGALIAFTKALAIEWARHNVTVNAVAPGYFRTDLNRQALDDVEVCPKTGTAIPLRRVGRRDGLATPGICLTS